MCAAAAPHSQRRCDEAPGAPPQTSAMMYAFSPGGCGSDPSSLPAFELDLANFLLIRGPYAYLGHGWLGCSHDYAYPAALDADYGAPLDPFDSDTIDTLILEYARRMLRLPDWSIAARWHGVYAKGPDPIHFSAEPQPGCFVMGSPGGAGMTLAFGLAERWWDSRNGPG